MSRPGRSAPPPPEPDPAEPPAAVNPGTQKTGDRDVPRERGESRYRRRPSPPSGGRNPEQNRVLRLTLTEPDTAPMTEEQHQQAVSALSAMIVSWLQRRARGTDNNPPPAA